MTTWTKLGYGGSFNAYFRRPVALPGGDIWMAWGQNSSADHGSFIFRAATGTFEKTHTLSGAGYDIGARENYGAWHDGDRNCVWVGMGAPVAYSQPGELKFDLTTKVYEYLYPTGFGAGDGAFLYHGDHLYSVGGWSNNYTRRRNLTTGVVSAYGGSPAPQFVKNTAYPGTEGETARLVYARTGMRPDGTIWTLDYQNELWTCPLNGTWVKHATTGDKPDTLGVVACVVEGSNTLVAWCGKTGMVGADAGVVRRQTWLLDLATKIWRKGPGLPAGEVVPPAQVSASTNLISDGTNALLIVDGAAPIGKTEVWKLA